jgi:hypothetical protein
MSTSLKISQLPKRAFASIRIRGQGLIRDAYIRALAIKDSETLRISRKNWGIDGSFQEKHTPTICVVVATYNRATILVDRTLPSVFAQTYRNLRVIVVGDNCTDDTEERVASLNSLPITFVNLAKRGKYPSNPQHRRLVAGVDPLNKAHELASGNWVAHLDDDDIWDPDHLEKLMKMAQEGNYEFVSSIMLREITPGHWIEIHSGHSTFLYSPVLSGFRYVRSSWRVGLGGDSTMLHRLRTNGVSMGFVEKITAYAPLRPGTTRYDHLAEDRV